MYVARCRKALGNAARAGKVIAAPHVRASHITRASLSTTMTTTSEQQQQQSEGAGSNSGSSSNRQQDSSFGQKYGLAFFGTMVVTTFGLGTWQALRYGWKVEVLEQRKRQLAEAPLDLSEGWRDDDIDPSVMGTRRVSISGTFDYSREVRITPRPAPKDAPQHLVPPTATGGYLAITPLVRSDGTSVLVIRGWVPHSASGSRGAGKGSDGETGGDHAWGPHDASATGPSGVLTVTGVLREPENPGALAVKHYPERNEFSWVDLPSIAEHTGTMRRPQPDQSKPSQPMTALPLLVEAVAPHPEKAAAKDAPSQPITKQLNSFASSYVMPTTHLVYAATWYALAVFGMGITYSRFVRGSKGALGQAAASAARRGGYELRQGRRKR